MVVKFMFQSVFGKSRRNPRRFSARGREESLAPYSILWSDWPTSKQKVSRNGNRFAAWVRRRYFSEGEKRRPESVCCSQASTETRKCKRCLLVKRINFNVSNCQGFHLDYRHKFSSCLPSCFKLSRMSRRLSTSVFFFHSSKTISSCLSSSFQNFSISVNVCSGTCSPRPIGLTLKVTLRTPSELLTWCSSVEYQAYISLIIRMLMIIIGTLG